MARAGFQPFGDIYSAATPALDRASAILYQQEQQRKQQLQSYNKDMDTEMFKQLGNVKNVDIPDITDAWNTYKQTKQDLLFNRKIQNDPRAYADAQIRANAALGNVMQKIDASRQHRQLLDNLQKDFGQHPHNYDEDNFYDNWNKAMNTKTDQLGDLASPQKFLWSGPKTDFNKIEADARGKDKVYSLPAVPVDQYGVQSNIPQYKFGNTVDQYYNTYLNHLVTDERAAKDASKVWAHITPERIAEVNAAYDKISPEQWKVLSGNGQPYNMPLPNTDAERLAAFNAKMYAVNAKPETLPGIQRTNKEAYLNQKYKLDTQKAIALENLRNAHIKDRAEFRHNINQIDAQDQPDAVDQYLKGIEDRAKLMPKLPFTVNGQQLSGWNIPLAPALVDAFETKDSKGHTVRPDEIRQLDNGSMYGIFYERDPTTGNVISSNKSNAISKEIRPIQLPRDAVLGNMVMKLEPKKEVSSNLPKTKIVLPSTKQPKVSTLPHGAFDNIGEK